MNGTISNTKEDYQCKAIALKTGKRCNGIRIKGTDFCLYHSKQVGKIPKKDRVDIEKGLPYVLKKIAEFSLQLERKKISPMIANAQANLMDKATKLHEVITYMDEVREIKQLLLRRDDNVYDMDDIKSIEE